MKQHLTDMKTSTAIGLPMTAIERSMGRLMRAPDHSGGEGGGAADAGAAGAAGDQGGAAAGGDEGDTSALGGAVADDKGGAEGGGDKAEAGDDAEGDKPKEGEAKEGDEKPGEVPDAYELKPSEGKTLDAELVNGATETFKELGLTNDQAQKLIPLAESIVEKASTGAQEQAIAAAKAQSTKWLEEAKADETIGGDKFKSSLASSAKAMDALGFDQDFRTFLNETGIGNKREIIAAFSALGQFVGEDNKFAIGTKGAGGGGGNVAHQMYPNDAPKK